MHANMHARTHTHPFYGPLDFDSGITRVSQYQKGKTNLDFTGARDSEWQWHQLGHMQICTLPQTDNHASIPPLSFLQARYPSYRPTNSVTALKAHKHKWSYADKYATNWPEYNAVEVERVLNDACGWHADSENILKCRQIVGVSNLVYAVQIATHHAAFPAWVLILYCTMLCYVVVVCLSICH